MDTVIVMAHTKIDYDSRIRRQVSELSKYYDIILCSQRGDDKMRASLPTNINYIFYDVHTNGIGGNLFRVYMSKNRENIDNLEKISDSLGLGIKALTAYEAYRCDLSGLQKDVANYLKEKNINVKAIISNDISVLPMAYRLKNILYHKYPEIKLIGDMHEIHFDYAGMASQFSKDTRIWISDNYLPKCDVISVTSDWAVKLYSNRYKKIPIIAIRNVAQFHDIRPTSNSQQIRLVHVGDAQRIRKIEKMIECMMYLDEKYILDLYLTYGETNDYTEYISFLKQYILNNKLENRVRIMNPTKPELLVKTINEYDIGIFYLKPAITNHIYALPNKLFEYIQGRVAVVTTPLKSMKEIIENYEVGVVSDNYEVENFAAKINEVSTRLAYYKEQSDKASWILNSEKEWGKIINYIQTGILNQEDYIKGYRLLPEDIEPSIE